jgi:hypothetical protein
VEREPLDVVPHPEHGVAPRVEHGAHEAGAGVPVVQEAVERQLPGLVRLLVERGVNLPWSRARRELEELDDRLQGRLPFLNRLRDQSAHACMTMIRLKRSGGHRLFRFGPPRSIH